MWHMASIHLARIGPPAARCFDERLELGDEFNRPMDSIVWLRNGGGKSSVLALLCAHLRPHRNDFLATSATDKHLEDYVQSGDTSHTIIEWADQAGQRLITGAVYEWDNLQAPEDPTKNHDRLTSTWYALTPSEGMHSQDLPRADADGRPLRLKEYTAALRALPADHELEVCPDQTRWRRTLDNHGMDPDLLTPILTMNATEGGIDAAFSFANPDAFIRYLLSLVADPKSAANVGATLEKVRLQLAARPKTLTDLAFASESEPALRKLGASYDKHRRAADALEGARRSATELAASFGARIGATEELLGAHADNSSAAAARRATARTARDTATFSAAELRRVAAVLRAADAGERLERSEGKRVAASERLAALAAVEPLAAQQRQDKLVEELAAQLAQQEQGAAPLADSRDGAAAVLYRVLTQELAKLVTAESAHVAATTAAKAKRKVGRADVAGANGQLGVLAANGKHYRKVIATVDASLAQARADKVLTAEEEPAPAVTRLSATDAAAAAAIEAIDTRRQVIGVSQAGCHTGLLAARGDATKANTALNAARRENADLVAAVSALSANPAVADLAQDDNVDVLAEARELASAATGKVERLDRERMRHAVDTAEARRALAELEICHLLPPDLDLERALGALAEAGIDATSGWRYLADNMPVAQHGAVLACAPSLVAGVAVHDAAQLVAARQVLTSYPLRPITAIGVGTTADLHAAAAGSPAGTWVIAPAPALTDRAQAQQEIELRDLEVSQADQRDSDLSARRENDAALQAELSALADRYTPAVARRLGEDLEAAASRDEAATAKLAGLEQEEDDLAGEDMALVLERESLQEARRVLSKDLARLGAIVEASGPVQAARVDLAALPALEAAQHALQKAGELAETEADGELRRVERAREVDEQARLPMSTQRDQLPQAARVAPVEAGPASVPLSSARSSYEQAAAAYDQATSGSALAIDLRVARTVMETYTRAVSLVAMAVRQAAQGLLESGIDPTQLPALIRHANVTEAAAGAELVEAKTEASRAADELRATTPAGRDRHRVLEGPEPATRADALAGALAQDAVRDAALVAENAAAAEFDALERAATGYRQLVSHLTTMISSLPALDTGLGSPRAFPGDVESARTQATAANVALSAATLRDTSARVDFDALAHEIFLWANHPRFAAVTEQMRSRFRSADLGANLAPEATALAIVMGEAAASLRAHLDELDEHQKTAVTAMRGMVRGALKTLARLQASSALPDTLPAWAGQRFLTVGPKRSVEHTDEVMDDRIGLVVAAMCSAGSEIPKGPDLLWAATHAVVGDGNWTAKVLKPTVDGTIELSTVTKMRKWSGGEKVTANLLLFALAVRVRATERGRDHVGFGVLPLDNPLGKASYVPFLELQRKVAAAYGIQLLFLTGVGDLRAVGRFPNIIRMANQTLSGRRYVGVVGRHVEEGATGQLSHARILRPDPIPGL
jgi:hypothetical protein